MADLEDEDDAPLEPEAIELELSDVLDLPVWTLDHHLDVLGAQVWR